MYVIEKNCWQKIYVTGNAENICTHFVRRAQAMSGKFSFSIKSKYSTFAITLKLPKWGWGNLQFNL